MYSARASLVCQYEPSSGYLKTGRPTTLRELLRTHVPLLFPPPPSVPLAYAIVQGVVTPGDAEIAWLNACMAGVDGWLSIFVGIGIVES